MGSFHEFLLIREQAGQFGYRGVGDYSLCKRRGLVPNWRHEGKAYLYFAKDEDDARRYGTIIVRFPWPHDAQADPGNSPFYFVTESPISPDIISVKLDDYSDDFVPIKGTKMVQNIISRAGKDSSLNRFEGVDRRMKTFFEWMNEDTSVQQGQQPNDDHLVRTMASSLHDDWRKARLKGGTHGQADAAYEPKMKPSGLDDGKEVDIAQHYDKLTPRWQAENKAAASAAIGLVRQAVASGKNPQQLSSGADMEALADKVHQAWMQRNPKDDHNAAQHVPYASLPEDEKQKDRDHVTMAIKLLSKQ